MLKIRGAGGPVCLPHAVPVSGSELCPTEWRLATFAHLNLWMWEPVNRLNHMLSSLTLKKKARASRHLGVTEWCTGRDVRRQPRNCPYKICSCCPIYITQWTPLANISSGRGWWGVWWGYDIAGIGGVNLPCGWYRIRGQLPSTGGWQHTHSDYQFIHSDYRVQHCHGDWYRNTTSYGIY